MTTGKRFAIIFLIFTLPLIAFAQDAGKSNPTEAVLKGAVEADFDQYFVIYNLDVFSFFNLYKQYDTDLKRAVFKKTPEYSDKLKELQDKKKTLMGETHYVALDGEISNYDMKRKGITISTGTNWGDITSWAPKSIKRFSPSAIKIQRENCYFMGTRIPDAYSEHIFIPLSQEQGLKIESASNGIKKYFIFKISGMKAETFTSVTYSTKERGRWNAKVFTTNHERLVLINSATGEVLYDKVFNK